MTHTRTARRAGFTLVELLIVIAIIAILIALLLPALSAVVDAAARARTRSEISQLDVSVAAAKRDLSFSGTELPYLPSEIVLCDTWSDYAVTSIPSGQGWDTRVTLANLATSKEFLQKVFGKNIGQSSSGTLTLDWNGSGGSPDKPAFLTGEQALVFWLGGIPQKDSSGTRGDCSGFASNPADPTKPAGSAQSGARKGPYFDFKPGQLYLGSNGFLAYMDTYQSRDSSGNPVPYVYYSSNGNGSYNAATSASYIPSGGPLPYKDPLGKFVNPRTYQLISAGKDGVFGNTSAGSNWDPTTGWPPTGANAAGRDDLANFSPNALGKPAS